MPRGGIVGDPLRMEKEGGFFGTIEDLPIMLGLHEITEGVTTFDTLAGPDRRDLCRGRERNLAPGIPVL